MLVSVVAANGAVGPGQGPCSLVQALAKLRPQSLRGELAPIIPWVLALTIAAALVIGICGLGAGPKVYAKVGVAAHCHEGLGPAQSSPNQACSQLRRTG